MKKSTIIGCFVGVLALTMNAQVTQPSSSRSDSGTTQVESQNKPTTSLLDRGDVIKIKNNAGLVSNKQNTGSTTTNQRPERATTAIEMNGGVAKQPQHIPLFVPRAENNSLENGGLSAPKTIQYIYENPYIYGSRNAGQEKPAPRISLEELLLRLQSYGNQIGIDTEQQFTPAEKQVLYSYLKSQNSNNKGPNATLLDEGFDDITTLPGAGFTFVNASDAVGLTEWFQGNDLVFSSQSGAATSYIGANYNSTAGSVINNFMITPILNLENGDEIKFWTRTTTGSTFPDRLEVRIDPTGANTDPAGPTGVGSYTELLLEVNPTLVVGGYPEVWTEYTVTVAGLGGATDTRVAFRYTVTDAGPLGNNSDYIGIDSLTIEEGAGGGGGGAASTVYAKDGGFCTSGDFGSFPVDGPYTIAPGNNSPSAVFAGDFDGSGTLYGLHNDDLNLLIIDKTTGAETVVGPLTNMVAGHTASGLSWNEADGTMYMCSTDTLTTTIYTVDLATGTLTVIGNASNAFGGWIAIDTAGNAFMADIGDDNLYSVNLSTGASTLVGPLGININFAQDADFDPATDTLYMGAYIGGGVNQFCSVDTTTGAVTQLGTVNADCAELTIVAIEGDNSGGGTACSQDNPSNGFENGFTSSSSTPQVIAADITIPADTNMNLDSIVANWLVVDGDEIDTVEITIYENLGGFPDPANIVATISGLAPTSQPVIGDFPAAPILDVIEASFDFPAVMLNGQAGAPTTYWISIYATNVAPANNSYWEMSTATVAGFDGAFSGDNGATWGVAAPGADQVYVFSGECEPMGGGTGTACEEDNLTGIVVENGFGASNPALYYAADLRVGDTQNFTLNQISASFLTATGRVIDEVSVSYFEDDGTGLPGLEIGQQTAVVPTSDTNVGPWPVAPTFDMHEVVVDLDPFVFNGQIGSETTYWILVRPSNDLDTDVYWSVTSSSIVGNYGAGRAALPWTQTTIANGFPDDYEFIYKWSGECEDIVASNDDCSGAIAVACGDSLVGETITASDSGGNAAPDVFYKYTGSGSAEIITVSLCAATDFDTVLRVFDDCDLANELAVNDDSCGVQSELSFLSDGTSTYYIMVEGFGSNSGNFSIDITCDIPLANDDCDGAIAVSCGDSITGTTINATVDSSAPACGPVINSPGVWYTLDDTSGLPGDITLSLCAATDFDSKISVFTGTCSALVCVDGNDDACGLQSEITFSTDGNTKFYILIHSFGGATGNFSLDVTCTPTPPPNDLIVNSIDVDEIGFPYTDPAVAMPAATTEGGNPSGCDLTGANGVWYNFVPFADGTANATIVTPGGASSVTFYTAPNESAVETDLTLVPLNTNQCAPGTNASINTVGGQAYYVFVLNSGAITDIQIDGTNLGVSDNTIAGFSYYPNPTTGMLNLNSVDNIENVTLFNVLGQKVLDTKIGATTSELNISSLKTGTYLMQVTVNGQTGTFKVLKN